MLLREGQSSLFGSDDDLFEVEGAEVVVNPGALASDRDNSTAAALTPAELKAAKAARDAELVAQGLISFDKNHIPDLDSYTRFVVFFSGGKDSICLLLRLLELGVDKSKIELHHHLVDGENDDFFDWPVTESYCRSFAAAFGIPIKFSWKEGGFRRELTKTDAPSAPIMVPMADGTMKSVGGEGGPATRNMYPATTADLQKRWCSGLLKIDVGRAWMTHDLRFSGAGEKTLVLTGERAEESAARAKYRTFEPYARDLRNAKNKDPRYIDHSRLILGFTEKEVWELMRKWSINAHPSYHLGLGRASCRFCIFGSHAQWATMKVVDPKGLAVVGEYEKQFATEKFGGTIHRIYSVEQRAAMGEPLAGANSKWAQIAMSREYLEPVIVPPNEWELPIGAYGESCGPT